MARVRPPRTALLIPSIPRGSIASGENRYPERSRRLTAEMLASRLRRLVEVEPVPPEVLHRLRELVEVGRFGDVGVGAELVALYYVFVLAGGGEEDDGDEVRPLVARSFSRTWCPFSWEG
jgi:hypothetical protein